MNFYYVQYKEKFRHVVVNAKNGEHAADVAAKWMKDECHIPDANPLKMHVIPVWVVMPDGSELDHDIIALAKGGQALRDIAKLAGWHNE